MLRLETADQLKSLLSAGFARNALSNVTQVGINLFDVIFPIVNHIGDAYTLHLSKQPDGKWRLTDGGWICSDDWIYDYVIPRDLLDSLSAVYNVTVTPENDVIVVDIEAEDELLWAMSNMSVFGVLRAWMCAWQLYPRRSD